MYNCEQEYAGYNQVYPNQLVAIQGAAEPPELVISEKETPVKKPIIIIKGVSVLKKNKKIVTDIKTLKENKLTIIGLCEDLNTN